MHPEAPDRVAYRDYLASLVQHRHAEMVIDLGCGTGHDLVAMAKNNSNPEARFVGIDASQKSIHAARDLAFSDDRVEFLNDRIDRALPFVDSVADVVYSHNFLECIADKQALLIEIARVLKPNGQVVFAHWDHDTYVFDGSDKNLTRMVVQAYSDWKQDWMDNADGWMGRRLWATFQESGLFEGEMHTYVLTNTEYVEPFMGHETISNFQVLAERGLVTDYSVNRIQAVTRSLAERDGFFFSLNSYVYTGRKRSSA